MIIVVTNGIISTYPQGEGLILPQVIPLSFYYTFCDTFESSLMMPHRCIHIQLILYRLKQALMVMAIFSNLMMYGSTDLLGDETKEFLCVSYKIYNPEDSTGYSSPVDAADVEPTSHCGPLVLFDPTFWDGLEEEQKGWHAAWQAAAALGAIGTSIGAITLVVLLRTVCFEVKKASVR